MWTSFIRPRTGQVLPGPNLGQLHHSASPYNRRLGAENSWNYSPSVTFIPWKPTPFNFSRRADAICIDMVRASLPQVTLQSRESVPRVFAMQPAPCNALLSDTICAPQEVNTEARQPRHPPPINKCQLQTPRAHRLCKYRFLVCQTHESLKDLNCSIAHCHVSSHMLFCCAFGPITAESATSPLAQEPIPLIWLPPIRAARDLAPGFHEPISSVASGRDKPNNEIAASLATSRNIRKNHLCVSLMVAT